jgi:hypothetical protein
VISNIHRQLMPRGPTPAPGAGAPRTSSRGAHKTKPAVGRVHRPHPTHHRTTSRGGSGRLSSVGLSAHTRRATYPAVFYFWLNSTLIMGNMGA